MIKTTLLKASLLLGLLLLVSCTPKILIGLVGCEKKENSASCSADGTYAVQQVVDEWNKKGGVLGRKIKILVENDHGREGEVAPIATDFVKKNVVAVIGHPLSNTSEIAASIYSDPEINILQISPTASAPFLTEYKKFPLFFRVALNDIALVKFGRDSLQKRLHIERVALFDDGTSYGKKYMEKMKVRLEGVGVEVGLSQEFPHNEEEESSLFSKLHSERFDAIVVGAYDLIMVESFSDSTSFQAYERSLIEFLREMRSHNHSIPVIMTGTFAEEQLNETLRKELDGVYFLTGGLIGASSLFDKWVSRYKETFSKEPSSDAIYYYSATEVLLQAVERAGTTDPQKVAEILKSERFETSMGEIGFDEKGDILGGYRENVLQLVDGEFISISNY